MEPSLEDWAASLMGNVESDIQQLLHQIGGTSNQMESIAMTDDAIDACSLLWQNMADEPMTDPFPVEPADSTRPMQPREQLARTSTVPPLNEPKPFLSRFSSQSLPDPELSAGALSMGSLVGFNQSSFSQLPFTRLTSDPMLTNLLNSDEFRMAVSAHGKKLKQSTSLFLRASQPWSQPLQSESSLTLIPSIELGSRSESRLGIQKENSGSGLKSGRRRSGSGSGSGSLSGRLESKTSLTDRLKPKSEHAISKKDTTQRKKQEISRLEQEVSEKMSLVRQLEEEKQQLWDKEKRVHFAAREARPDIKSPSASFIQKTSNAVRATVVPELASMIDSFRIQASREKANEVLKDFTSTNEKFTIKEYSTVMCSLVEELSDIVEQQEKLSGKPDSKDSDLLPDVCSRLNTVIPKIEGFVNSVMLLYAPIVGYSLSCDLRDPYTPLIRDISFWSNVREKIHLTSLQEANLHSIYRMYASLIQRETDKAAFSMAQIIHLSQDSSQVSSLSPMSNKSGTQLLDALQAFRSVNQRFMTLSCLLSYLIMTSLSPWQKAVACKLSFPSAVNFKLMMASLCHGDHQQQRQQQQ